MNPEFVQSDLTWSLTRIVSCSDPVFSAESDMMTMANSKIQSNCRLRCLAAMISMVLRGTTVESIRARIISVFSGRVRTVGKTFDRTVDFSWPCPACFVMTVLVRARQHYSFYKAKQTMRTIRWYDGSNHGCGSSYYLFCCYLLGFCTTLRIAYFEYSIWDPWG